MPASKSSIRLEKEQPNRFFVSRKGHTPVTREQSAAVKEVREEREAADTTVTPDPEAESTISDYFND